MNITTIVRGVIARSRWTRRRRLPAVTTNTSHSLTKSRRTRRPGRGGLKRELALEDFAANIVTKLGPVFYRFAEPGDL